MYEYRRISLYPVRKNSAEQLDALYEILFTDIS